MLVFIDESGDAGFKLSRGSSGVFVVALCAFTEAANASATEAAINAVASRLRLSGEFKFNKTRNEIKDAFFRAVVQTDFLVRAIVVEKQRIYSPYLRTEKEKFYSFFVRQMLSFDDGLLESARIIIDGSGDREFKQELTTYLRRYLAPGAIRDLRFSNSKNDRLVQLADMCAGAIARSYREDRELAGRWREMLRPRIDDVWKFR